jgi:hypothetical protein
VYRHVSTTWDEPSPEERKRAMGFQIDITSHTKVIRLEHNAILGRGMDLNSLTWLLVTCVLFKMYTTPTLIQSTCSFGDATTWHLDQIHLPIFNTPYLTLCRNPSFGLATKAKGIVRVRAKEEVRELNQKNARESRQKEARESHHILPGV